MSILWGMLAAGLVGFGLAYQPAINGATATTLGTPIVAATLSLWVAALIVSVLMFLSGPSVSVAQLAALPWWSVLGGVFGAAFVVGGAALVPVTGAAVFFVCLIAGQLAGAVLIDAIGAFGLEPRVLSLRKIAGVSLAFVGVVLVRWG